MTPALTRLTAMLALTTLTTVTTAAPDRLEILEQQALHGDTHAQYILGLKLEVGDGVPQDTGQAITWFRKAASQGDAFAQISLAEHYQAGDGVPRDYVLAYCWLTLAADAGIELAARHRRTLESQMTGEQLAQARQLIASWQPGQPIDNEPLQ